VYVRSTGVESKGIVEVEWPRVDSLQPAVR
jgi:hypothetical protein